MYLSSSPAALCPPGREPDLSAILRTIDSAEKFVEIAVMDYIPATLYTPHMNFWPDIDSALRRAAIDRGTPGQCPVDTVKCQCHQIGKCQIIVLISTGWK